MLGMGDDDSSTTLSYCTMNPMACQGGWSSPSSPTGPANSSTNIFDTIMLGINASSKILSTRYGVPQLNSGQYIQTGPNGQSVMYQLAPGQSSGFPGLSTFGTGGMSSGMLLPIIGIGLVVLMVMSKKG